MNKSNHLYNIYLLFFFVILTLPLVSLPPFFHPPDFAKTSIMRGLFPFLLCLLLYQVSFGKNLEGLKEIKKSILDKKSSIFLPFWLFIAYLSILLLATIFSLDIKTSLWDYPMRGGGAVIISFLILFSLIVFSIIKPKDWQKVWDYSLAVGGVVALIALFQKFSFFSGFLLGYADRPVSTMGGSIFLSLYLVLLAFLAVSFAILKKNRIRKAFYIICAFLYLSAIGVSATRAAFLGLAIGTLFFVFFYPSKSKKAFKMKMALVGLIILMAISGLWLNTQPQLVQKISDNNIIGSSFHRTWSLISNFSWESIFYSRASGWVIGLRALKDRPILGYGPENFSIAFDKYYDPNLPGINMTDPSQGSTSWWDRAHSFAVEIAVTNGIPALIIYLSLFAVIFWKLQKVKKENPQYALISHGLQTGFISYLIADFFGFDVFSTYLIAFLLIAYSLFIIKESKGVLANVSERIQETSKEDSFWKYPVMALALIIALVFGWNYSAKALIINRDLNVIEYWADVVDNNPTPNKNCPLAFAALDKIMNEKKSILDVYSRLVYVNIIGTECGLDAEKQGSSIYYKTVQRLEEVMKTRPYYTRNYLFHIVYTYKIIETDKTLSQEAKEKLLDKALVSYQKALSLSPGRQPVYAAGAKLQFSKNNPKEALKILDQCFAIKEDYPNCHWTKANILLRIGKTQEASQSVKASLEQGYFKDNSPENKTALLNLINLYTDLLEKSSGKQKEEYYRILSMLYESFVKIPQPGFQDYATLAYIYRELKEYDKAREAAAKVLELSPENKATVEQFLKTLPYE